MHTTTIASRSWRGPAFVLAAFMMTMFLSAAWAAPAVQQPAETPVRADAGKETPPPPKPGAKAANATPVMVELEGTDTIGAKLAFQLKETFNAGSMFTVTAKDTPKIRILIATEPEFASRPAVGSAYSVIWTYYINATSFSSYLASEVGTVDADGVNDLAARLAERTSGIMAKYAYIFEK